MPVLSIAACYKRNDAVSLLLAARAWPCLSLFQHVSNFICPTAGQEVSSIDSRDDYKQIDITIVEVVVSATSSKSRTCNSGCHGKRRAGGGLAAEVVGLLCGGSGSSMLSGSLYVGVVNTMLMASEEKTLWSRFKYE